MENRERKTIIEQAVVFLNSNAFSRYMVIPYDCSQPTIRDPAGYRKQEGPNADGWTFYTFPHVFINETAHGFNPQAVEKILSEHGMLKHDKDREGRYTARLRVDGRYTRLYALLFASEGDAAQEDDV